MGFDVYVIGGCGKVGHALAPSCVGFDEEVIWRSIDLVPPHDCPWDTCSQGDALNLGQVFQDTRKGDGILYLAMGSMDNDASLFAAAVHGWYNALLVAKTCNTCKVIFASSISVSCSNVTGDPDVRVEAEGAAPRDDPYCVSKLAAEAIGKHFADAFGMSIWALRLGTPLPDDVVAEKRANGQDYPSLLAVSDLADCLLRIVHLQGHKGFELLNVAGDLTGRNIDLSRAKSVLGWEPQR
jgi:nucleoside-diphosphate-sugar epimerase